MASGREVKCAAGGGGDGDRIGGERGALALFKLDVQWKCYSITRTLSLVPDPPRTYASDSSLARRDVQDEVDAALRTGAAEIANDAGAVLYRLSIERE